MHPDLSMTVLTLNEAICVCEQPRPQMGAAETNPVPKAMIGSTPRTMHAGLVQLVWDLVYVWNENADAKDGQASHRLRTLDLAISHC